MQSILLFLIYRQNLHVVNVIPYLSIQGICPKLVNGKMREMQFFFWNLKEFHLLMEGATYCNPFDIVSFLKNCPCLEKIFIDVSIPVTFV